MALFRPVPLPPLFFFKIPFCVPFLVQAASGVIYFSMSILTIGPSSDVNEVLCTCSAFEFFFDICLLTTSSIVCSVCLPSVYINSNSLSHPHHLTG